MSGHSVQYLLMPISDMWTVSRVRTRYRAQAEVPIRERFIEVYDSDIADPSCRAV